MLISPIEQIPSVVEVLTSMNDDPSIPKNVRIKIQTVVTILNNSEEATIKVNKALEELDEINEDTNLQQYIRTQIWNVVSILSQIN
jgi:uncharacterized protein (UPF0147 family)